MQGISWAIIYQNATDVPAALLEDLALLSLNQPIYGVCLNNSDKLPQLQHITLADLYAQPAIQAVYLIVAQERKAVLIQELAKAHKHICCQPPLALDLTQAQATLAQVKQSNVICLEAFAYRFHPLMRELQSILAAKVLGSVRYFQVVYYQPQTSYFADLAAPALAVVRHLAGAAFGKHAAEPDHMLSMGMLDQQHKITNAQVALNFPNHMRASLAVAEQETQTHLSIFGTAGHLQVLGNPWQPAKATSIMLKLNDQPAQKLDITADYSAYFYLCQALETFIREDQIGVFNKDVAWMDSLGNLIATMAWENQITDKHKASENS